MYHGRDSLVSRIGDAQDISVSDSGTAGVRIKISSDICVYRISGRIVGKDGNSVANDGVWAQFDGGSTWIQTDSDGSFAITVPSAGSYRLSTKIDGCTVYYKEGGVAISYQSGKQIRISDADITGLRFALPVGVCSTKISGRLLDTQGEGIANASVWAQSEDANAHTRTESDGSFAITAPSAGTYRLFTSIDGCSVYFRRGGAVTSREQATRITIDERDATGILFQLREGQCATRIAGRLLDAEGNPLASTQVSAVPENGSWSSTQTESDGSFSITVPGAGQYRVSTRIDGCTVYYRRSGATGSYQQATQIRVSDSDVTGVRLQLAEGMCELRISGKLLNADGSPRSGQWVSASGNAGSGGAQAGSDGSFSFAVPGKGSYRLSVWIDGCSIYRGSRGPTKNWNSARQISVSNADVTGLVFRLPEHPSTFCD